MNFELILHKLQLFAQQAFGIKSIARFGSVVNKTADQYSDLKLAVQVTPDAKIDDVMKDIQGVFDTTVFFTLAFPKRNRYKKLVLFFRKSPQRIDAYFYRNFIDLAEFWKDRASASILYDPTGKLQSHLSSLPERLKKVENTGETQTQIKNIISRALYYFQIASEAHQTRDAYRFYLYHNRLVQFAMNLQALLKGQAMWKQPAKHALRNLLLDGEHQYFLDTMLHYETEKGYIQNSNQIRRDFLDWFYDLLERVQDTFSDAALPKPLEDIVNFCEIIYENYYFWNFRPIRGTKKLFRTPLPWNKGNKRFLKRWLSRNDIKTIIDLRRPSGVELIPPDERLVEELDIELKNISFNAPPGKKVDAPPYLRLLVQTKDRVNEIFNILLDSCGGVQIHCVAGQDRTGIISALLQLLLGLPKSSILADYELTGGHPMLERKLDAVLDHVKEQGGIETFLASCGFEREKQERLVEKIKAT